MLSRFMIVGKLAKPYEMKLSNNGLQVGTLVLAVYDKGKKKNSNLKMSIFGEQAEAANSDLQQGEMIAVEGKVSSYDWLDKNGETQSSIQLIASSYSKLGMAENPVEENSADFNRGNSFATQPSEMDDAPF